MFSILRRHPRVGIPFAVLCLGISAALSVSAQTGNAAGTDDAAASAEKVLNIYSARHYQTDQVLYDTFTKTSGVKINIINADDAGVVTRLRTEGAASPADVVLLVDAARLAQADRDGLFQPIHSAVLDQRIPANLRSAATPQGRAWTGFSTRARVIVYDPKRVQASDVANYAQLADPKLKGLLCTRSGSHPYNLSLFAAETVHMGPAKAQAWLQGLVDNMARSPKGGDTDQIKGVASGECGVAITNSYYLARMMRSDKVEDKDVVSKIKVVFPDQQGRGTHINVAGGAVAKHAPHRAYAIAFLEFLSSDFAQRYFADGNNEFAAAKGVTIANPALSAMGADQAKLDNVPLGDIAKAIPEVQKMLDRVGYK